GKFFETQYVFSFSYLFKYVLLSYKIRPSLAREKIPAHLENYIRDAPVLKPNEPVSIIKFIEFAYDLNALAPEYFEPIFERIAYYQKSSVLKLMIKEKINTYDRLRDELFQRYTSSSIRMQYQIKFIYRNQREHESFREFN
ncbi:hypothetical protein, partial [Klebsiella pneumoniae]|uniref:hypothetical protein n=1 Tax=Klebsiella pneumoniae TaxID=573 RepID=UPI0040557FB5